MSDDITSVDLADRITEAYYGLIPNFSEKFFERTRRRVHWICGQTKGDSILDIGCSQGIISILLAREGKQCLGLDINALSVEQALEYLKSEPEHVRNNINFICADAVLHDYAGQKFDTILLTEILEHLVYPSRLLELAAGLLNPNGRIVVTVPFGINAFPDHKATYYGHKAYELLAKHFFIEDIAFLDAWIGFAATNDTSISCMPPSTVWAKTEDAFLRMEEFLRNDLSKTQTQLKKIKEQQADSALKLKEAKTKAQEMRADFDKKLADAANREADYACKLKDKEAKIQETRNSTSFMLSESLLRAVTSWRGFIGLPGELIRIRRECARRTQQAEQTITVGNAISLLERGEELEVVKASVNAQFTRPKDRAVALHEIAKSLKKVNLEAAARFAAEALQCDPRPSLQKWAAFLQFDAGAISEPYAMLSSLPPGQRLSESEERKAAYIKGCYTMLTAPLPVLADAQNAPADSETKRILYIAASSLPYHITGYTIRTHALLRAFTAKGWDMLCLTRPGYPQDRPDAIQAVEVKDAIVAYQGAYYCVTPGPHRRKTPLDVYLAEAADQISSMIEVKRPSIIHAASNYEAAYPALLAAKRKGLPFIYEVRGLWEYSGLANRNSKTENERFQLDKRLESFVLQNADHVFTLTRQLAEELEKRGASPKKLSLLPNAIDPAALEPLSRDTRLAEKLGLGEEHFVIGYIGAVVPYEGLDDLIRAMTIILPRHNLARLVIVGDGQQLQDLKSLAQQHALEKEVIFTEKVPYDNVPSYYSLLNALALPRKPYEVCRLVSPLKSFEAMRMKIPLVVSDVDALKDMVQDNKTALVCKAGDYVSLAECIVRIIENPELTNTIKQNAYQVVMNNHTWDKRADDVSAVYSKFTN